MATKQSQEFEREIRGLIDALESDTVTASERIRIAEILLKNTTDARCMVKATPLEPVFVLRANDPIAAATVGYWCDAAYGIHEQEKIIDALAIAGDMISWQQRGEKLPIG